MNKAIITRTPKVTIYLDQTPIPAHEGERVLTALLRAGIWHLRDAPSDGAPRGGFCCMGVCQECLVCVQDQHHKTCIESCRLTAYDGLEMTSLKIYAS
ncbi:MAG: (2Fe-2S)-binding protein [Pseudomonadota bacterium]